MFPIIFSSVDPLLLSRQETMMDHALRTISYIADIGNIVVLMARRRMPRSASQDCIETTPGAQEGKKQYKMICHVFESEDVSKPSGVMRPPRGPDPAQALGPQAHGKPQIRWECCVPSMTFLITSGLSSAPCRQI